MITVSITINNRPLFARTAVNVTKDRGGNVKGCDIYYLDTGVDIYHRADDGAVALAKQMLDTIKEL